MGRSKHATPFGLAPSKNEEGGRGGAVGENIELLK